MDSVAPPIHDYRHALHSNLGDSRRWPLLPKGRKPIFWRDRVLERKRMGDVPMKKMAANKALQAIGAKVRRPENADVG